VVLLRVRLETASPQPLIWKESANEIPVQTYSYLPSDLGCLSFGFDVFAVNAEISNHSSAQGELLRLAHEDLDRCPNVADEHRRLGKIRLPTAWLQELSYVGEGW
jgi:hypothetical protein